MRVLLSAYACRPNTGSEPGVGWSWATHLAARGTDVHVLVAKRNQEAIEAGLRTERIPNLQFTYVSVPAPWTNKSEGLHYVGWQLAALKAARRLSLDCRFDLVHHVTYASVHVPSQLWRLGIPVVFGPVGGGQVAPETMLCYFGPDQRKEKLRTVVTRTLRLSPFHRYCLQRMSFVFAANEATLKLVQDAGCKRAELMCDTASSPECLAEHPRAFADAAHSLRLLWVGRILPRKALPLALDALKACRSDATLTIAGDGMDERSVRQMIESRSLSHKVFWKGKRLTPSELRAAYAEHDAMLFTSLRDSFGSQVLEALGMALPVVALDLSGVHDHVPESASLKVPVGSPETTVKGLAAAIDKYASFPGKAKSEMSKHAWNFAKGMSWAARVKHVEELYESLCAESALFETPSPARVAAAKI